MSKRPDLKDWEDQINALLDGELDEDGAEALKAAAQTDQQLAAAIIEAYQLQQALAAIETERAPASLQRKLRRVPREHAPRRTLFSQPRWAMALAAVPLVVLVAVSQLGPREPSAAEIAQARQELGLALAYLEKASRMTERKINTAFDEGISEPVTENAVRAISNPFNLDKEHST